MLNPIKPKLFWGLPGPRGPPPEFVYFSADCNEIWHRCKTSHNLKDSTIKISQGHHVGAHFHKKLPKIRKYVRKNMAYSTIV